MRQGQKLSLPGMQVRLSKALEGSTVRGVGGCGQMQGRVYKYNEAICPVDR